MSHLYKQYMRLAAKWPVDKHKSDARNYRYFLEKQVAWIFGASHENLKQHRDDKPALKLDELTASYHDANIRALRELTSDEHKKRWPSQHYTTGIFGLHPHQLREANTERAREEIGITTTRWKSLRSMFWRS